MSITNIAGILSSAKGAITGGYKLNKASSKEMVELRLGVALQSAEFMALATAGAEPDVLLGFFPIYLVTDLEAGKSSKTLRFRGIGGHLLAFNKGEGNTLIIKFSLVGPLAPLYLQLLDMTYYYGSEKNVGKEIKGAGGGAPTTIPGVGNTPVLSADTAMTSNATECIRFGNITDGGQQGTFNQAMTSGGDCTLPNDMKTTQVASSQVDMNQMEISDRKVTKNQWGDVDEHDWEIVIRRRTFNVITKNEIFTRMYIETMLHAERKDMAQGEIEVDLLLRKYVEPPPKTRYIFEKAGTEDAVSDKKAIDKNNADIEKMMKQGAKLDASMAKMNLRNDLSKKLTPTQVTATADLQKQKFELMDKITNARQANAVAEQPRTKYTAGQGTTQWKQVTGILSEDIVDQGAVSMWFNLAWRGVGVATRFIFTPAPFAMDPMIGRLAAANDYIKANSRAGEDEKAGNSMALPIAAHVVTIDDDSVPIAPHQSPSINIGNASSTTYQQGVTFNADPTLVSVTLNGKTGVTEYNTPLVAWKDFLEFLGEDNTVDDIIDVLACTPAQKQDDMESAITYGCTLYKLSGAIPHDGKLAFSVPVKCSFRMEIQQNLGAEQFTPKMSAAGSEFTIQPGLVYYLGTGATPTWAINEDDGLVHVNKAILDEIYFYCKSVILAGDNFVLTGFFFYPMFGV
jgi:hypothetical protein